MGEMEFVGQPKALERTSSEFKLAAPECGEHTDEILMDVLKLSSGEVGRLHDKKVVAGKENSTSGS